MSLQVEPRFRVSAKQTAKNYWQLDATAEYKDTHMKRSANDPTEIGKEEDVTLALQLLSVIKDTEKAFREDGRKIVGDDSNQ